MHSSRQSHSLPSLYRALEARQRGTITDSLFRASIYSTVVPSSTFVNVTNVPDVTIRRFSPCGRYLLTISSDSRDFVVYSVETGGRRISTVPVDRIYADSESNAALFQSVAYPPLVSSVSSNSLQLFNTPLLIPPHQMLQRAYIPPSQPGLLAAFPIPLPPPSLVPQVHPPNPPPSPQISISDSTPHTCSFSRFFAKRYQISVPTGDERLLPDFCQVTASGRFVILASVLQPDPENGQIPNHPAINVPPLLNANFQTSRRPALTSTPILTSFSLHLVDIETGRTVDRFTLHNDYVPLDNHSGVYMLGSVLSVLSVRFQTIYILRIQETTPRFFVQAVIGTHCRPDDELVIATARHAEEAWQCRTVLEKRKRQVPSFQSTSPHSPPQSCQQLDMDTFGGSVNENPFRKGDPRVMQSQKGYVDSDSGGGLNANTRQGVAPSNANSRSRSGNDPSVETGFGNGKLPAGFYTGLMQRLLTYVYRLHLREGRQQRFYRVIGQYSLLLIQKVQLLDGDHLLIRLGSYERDGNPADGLSSTCFFLVYCISSTKIINLFDNKSTVLASLLDQYRDDFVGDAMVAASFLTTKGTGAADVGLGTGTIRRERATKRMRSILAMLPFSSQIRKPSVYLDRSLFSYTSNLLPALDGTKPLPLREIRSCKFLSAHTGDIRFKLAPAGLFMSDHSNVSIAQLSRTKMQFYFHPFLPLVLSMEYGVSFGTRYNIHVYGFHDRHDD